MKAATSASIAQWFASRPAGVDEAPVLAEVMGRTRSCVFADEPALAATLDLLDELGADAQTLAATMACAAGISDLPPGLARLVDGQREANRVWALHASRPAAESAEGLRRLLLAIIGDLRVVFVLLAQQLARMRTAAALPEAERRALAQLTADIHAPLANRLGIWQLKWELEDLAFRHLQPDTYRRVARQLDERREDREQWIQDAIASISGALAQGGIAAEVAGRPKHIFSIWKKMKRKGVDLEHLHDIRAVRILVRDVPDCYAALGLVHALWPPVPSEFDDYIARPKGNHYQSLHTALLGPGGKSIEVQIRTHEMHAHAELGVAAHWKYKEGGSGDAAFERKIAWMRQLLDGRPETDDDTALLAGLRTELMDGRVYLLTPQGRVIDLPRGATVLDFAYHVHTDVGHRCRGAKVNGRIAPLLHRPQSGDTVEILTGKVAAPRRDWLIAEHGFLATHRARDKVRVWFRHAEHARNVAAGRELLEKELRKLALSPTELERLVPKFNQKSLEELYVAVGVGEIGLAQVSRALHELVEPVAARQLPEPGAQRTRPAGRDNLTIEGVGNLLTVLARCCQPLPGDAIVGYLTRARGVSVHRADCRSAAALVVRDPARVVQVEWGERDAHSYEVDVLVRAYDRKGLLKDVSGLITAAAAGVIAASSRLDPAEGVAEMRFVLRVRDFGQLSGLLGKLSVLPNVLEARRVGASDSRLTAPDPALRTAKF